MRKFMGNFIQLHFLTSYPPANLNRDDLGRPKTALFGDALRLRISSQSLKRAWRESEFFKIALASHFGERTKLKGVEIYKKFIAQNIAEKKAKEWTKKIMQQFGKLKESKKNEKDEAKKPLQELEIEQLVHFSQEELQAINSLVEKIIATQQEPTEQELQLLRAQHSAADIACFGRMLANSPQYNTEAAVQVAHAISVHKVAIEDDYFTAVDDLNDVVGHEDSGAAHIGDTEFAAGLFYEYICIDRDQLKKNLQDNEELTQQTIAALVEAAAKVAPTGKQNSFASRAYASYMLAEKGDQQPRSLAVAFLEPITSKSKNSAYNDKNAYNSKNILLNAIAKLKEQYEKIDNVYGECAKERYAFNVEAEQENEQGNLQNLITFAKTE